MNDEIVYAEVTQVWPGCIIDLLRDKVVLTLTKMTDETQEAYVERCTEIVHYATSKSPKPEPPTIDFSDTAKYKQVGPTSWEALTPGYTPEQEKEQPYTCYVEGCTGAYFGTCDLCDKEGCQDHIATSSKFALDGMPFSYFCHPCHHKQREAYNAQQISM